MKKKIIVLVLALALLLTLTCCAGAGYAMSISPMSGGEDDDFDIDVTAGTYPDITVTVAYTGSEEEIEIYTSDPMVGLALYDGDGQLVGNSVKDAVAKLVTIRKDEPVETEFDLSQLAENAGGKLSEGTYSLEVTLSYSLSQETDDNLTVSRSFTVELT